MTSIKKAIPVKKKELTKFKPAVRSRHPSHNAIRKKLPLMEFRSVIRMGSTTDVPSTISQGGKIIEINTIEAVKNSANKKRMKNCFTLGGIKTADWFVLNDKKQMTAVTGPETQPVVVGLDKLPYPIIAKYLFGSRGTGNYKLDTQAALEQFIAGRAKDISEFIFEKFYNYSREYRLHCTEDGCFYTCRKMLKKDTPEKDKWFKNDSNSVWIVEENEAFDKPANWKEIEVECVKALEATELDVASFDVRVQGAKTEKGKVREKVDFIIIECNSASSFGERTEKEYLKTLPVLLKKKALEYGIIKKA